MRKVLFLIIGLFPLLALQAQSNLALGFRLGELNGLTLKQYNDGQAFELSVGRVSFFNPNRSYFERFESWYRNKGFPYYDISYMDHRVGTPFGVQLHYLRQNIFLRQLGVKGLQWYYGVGGQIRFQTYRYDYRYKLEKKEDWRYATDQQIADTDIGLDILIGLEYLFQDAPIGFFLDINLFLEIVDDPFLFWTQGGIGGRYSFGS